MRRATVSVLCLFFAVAGSACSSKEEKFAKHLARAEDQLAAGNDKEALIELRSALQEDPKSAEASWRIAELLRQQSKAGDALFFYRETHRLDPSRNDAKLMEASLLYGEDIDAAEKLIRDVLEAEPANAAAHLRMSELALVRTNVDEALAQAMTATQLDSTIGLYQQQLGIVHRARIREKRLRGEAVEDALHQSALEAFQKADGIDGPYWAYELEIARVYAGWPGHQSEAKAAYRKAVETAVASGDKNADLAALGEAQEFATSIQDSELQRWTLETTTKSRPEQIAAWVELARLEGLAPSGSPDAVYQRMIEQNAKSVEARVAYANWLVSKGQQDEAVEHLRQAVDGATDPPAMLGAVANLQLRLGRFDDAHATIDKMRATSPTHPRTTLAMAQLAIVEGHIADAVKLLREDTSAAQNPEAQRMLAFCEMAQQNLPAATQAINRAVELSPSFDPSIMRLRAQIQHLSKDFTAAIDTYWQLSRRNVALDGIEKLRWVQSLYESAHRPAGKTRLEAMLKEPDAPVEAALEYAYREGDTDPAKAAEVLEAALARTPGDARLVDYLTGLDVRAGRAPQALERLNKALAAGPVTAQLLVARGRLLASLKRWSDAEVDLRATFEAAPNYQGVSELLVEVYRAQGKVDQALASLEKADQSNALGSSQRLLLGRLYLQKGDLAQARSTYERVLAADPENGSAKNDLAYVLAVNKQELERALTLAQEAQRAQPDVPSITDTLGFVYLQKGLHDPAIQQLRYAIELARAQRRDRPDFHHHLALALAAAGRTDEAKAELDQALALDPGYSEAAEAKREIESSQAATASAPNPS
jgi:tetratricopeptide (TPR) repeat protein